MKKEFNILIRCDGSQTIGMGHIMRCLTLANQLNEVYKCKITFAIVRDQHGIDLVRKYNYNILSFSSSDQHTSYEDWLINCLDSINADGIILDVRDNLNINCIRDIRNKGILTVTIDDPEDKRIETDLAFYPPVPQVTKMPWDGFKGKLFHGWEYVILRQEFLKSYPENENRIPLMLVTMGATDPKKTTLKILESLKKIDSNFNLIVLLGHGSAVSREVEEYEAFYGSRLHLIRDANSVAEYMSTVDFAVASFGMTAYELAALNIPSIYICLTPDHVESSSIFVKSEIGLNLGLYSDISENHITESVKLFIQNSEMRSRLKENCKRLNLKSSSNNIAEIIFNELTCRDR